MSGNASRFISVNSTYVDRTDPVNQNISSFTIPISTQTKSLNESYDIQSSLGPIWPCPTQPNGFSCFDGSGWIFIEVDGGTPENSAIGIITGSRTVDEYTNAIKIYGLDETNPFGGMFLQVLTPSRGNYGEIVNIEIAESAIEPFTAIPGEINAAALIAIVPVSLSEFGNFRTLDRVRIVRPYNIPTDAGLIPNAQLLQYSSSSISIAEDTSDHTIFSINDTITLLTTNGDPIADKWRNDLFVYVYGRTGDDYTKQPFTLVGLSLTKVDGVPYQFKSIKKSGSLPFPNGHDWETGTTLTFPITNAVFEIHLKETPVGLDRNLSYSVTSTIPIERGVEYNTIIKELTIPAISELLKNTSFVYLSLGSSGVGALQQNEVATNELLGSQSNFTLSLGDSVIANSKRIRVSPVILQQIIKFSTNDSLTVAISANQSDGFPYDFGRYLTMPSPAPSGGSISLLMELNT